MIHFNANDLSPQQQYKFISGSVIPRPIAWVTTLSEDGKVVNAAPFSFFSAASNQLPLLTISILRQNNQPKDTAQHILDRKEAVIHIVDVPITEEMNETSAPLPRDKSELELTSLTLIDSKHVDVPAIKEAKIRFETTLYQHVPVSDEEGKIVTDLFLLKVSDYYFNEEVFDSEKQYIFAEVLNPTARLSGNQYAQMGETFTIVRPTE